MSVKRYWADALHPHEPRGGSIYVKSPVVFAADYDALQRERDEAVRLCAVHKEDAMREIAEANAQAAKLDEAVALLDEAEQWLGDNDDEEATARRIRAFLAKHKEQQ